MSISQSLLPEFDEEMKHPRRALERAWILPCSDPTVPLCGRLLFPDQVVYHRLATAREFSEPEREVARTSFESFLETTRLKRTEGEDANFDDAEQTEEPLEKEGIDVADVNRLSRDYRRRFARELPHPKMDALVEALKESWRTGRKALVFVRRVASTFELKRKLDECYDEWILIRLRSELPEAVRPDIERAFARYRQEREEELERGRSTSSTAPA